MKSGISFKETKYAYGESMYITIDMSCILSRSQIIINCSLYIQLEVIPISCD